MTPGQNLPRNLPPRTSQARARVIALDVAPPGGVDLEAVVADVMSWLRRQADLLLSALR